MKREVPLKWPKLLWSILIIAACTLFVERSSSNGPSILGIFGFFFVCWFVMLLSSMVVLLLRLFRVVSRGSFLYIFVAMAALFLAVCGLWLTRGHTSGYGFWVFLYFLTLAIGALMLIDIFLVEIPSFLDPSKK
jgi:hypothetical protein